MTDTRPRKRILAIDPATRCGWCWGDGTTFDYGVWDLGDVGETGLKLASLAACIRSVVARHGVDEIAYEEASYGGSGRKKYGPQWSTIVLHNQFRGVIESTATELGIPTLVYNIMTIKAETASNGRATKRDMIAAVRRHWGVELRDNQDNEADAIAIYQLAARGFRPTAVVKKERKKAERQHKARQMTLPGVVMPRRRR